MKLKTKMYLGFSTIITIFFIISGVGFYTLTIQKNNMENIVDTYYERVSLSKNLKFNIQVKSRLARDYLLRGNKALTAQDINAINERSNEAVIFIEQLKTKAVDDSVMLALVEEIDQLNQRYKVKIDASLEYLKLGNTNAAIDLLINDNHVRVELLDSLDRLTAIEEQSMDVALKNSMDLYDKTTTAFIGLITLGIIIVILIITTVIRSFTKSINKVQGVMAAVPKDSFENLPRIQHHTQDEFLDVANTYNEMAEELEKFTKEQRNMKKALQEENWVKTKYADLATKVQGSQKMDSFGRLFINNVALFVEANYGVFYFKNEKQKLVSEIASFAASGESNSNKKNFHLGEGLIGECALNHEFIVIENVPENYINIQSGLGKATPTTLIIAPIILDDEVIGVIELAKFQPFTSLQRRFLEQVCSSIGPNLNRITNHMEIARLLAESQTLTEELQTQSEELQQQQEELRTINEELHEENRRTEEKAKELEIIKRDLEQKNKEVLLGTKYKSEFLANMSHELRTPLNSMLILSQILAENNEGNLSAKQVEYATTIHSSGKDLLTLINDILDLAKVESGKLDVYPEQINISEIKAFVNRQFSPVSSYKGLHFQILIEKDTPEVIFTDDQRLKQILKNLLSNAFKFTINGSVTLKISPGNLETNSKIIFSIIDTGIGIEEEKQDIIFEAFSQVDGTTSRKFGGTGLGLSISRDLTQLLGGSITVESTIGKGSTFSLFLPDYNHSVNDNDLSLVAATLEEEQLLLDDKVDTEISSTHLEKLTDEVKEDLENKHVLIVDDDMRNVFALTSVLEKQNMKVIFAENGIEAIEILRSTKVDIILMDIMMPEMDGYEAMKKIREDKQYTDLPIIALTAKAMKNDREKCIAAGATDYISKPVDTKQLLSLINVWLSK